MSGQHASRSSQFQLKAYEGQVPSLVAKEGSNHSHGSSWKKTSDMLETGLQSISFAPGANETQESGPTKIMDKQRSDQFRFIK